jgi:predicted SAM-dependent methyltransferase
MIKLNICCGAKPIPGDWVNIDIVDRGHNIVVEDIRKLPYEDDSVDVIYSSHTLEYLNREEGFEALKEFYRVLKKGGKVYISVPDFRRLAKLYVEDDVPLFRMLGPLYGQMEAGGTVYHKTVYDEGSLGDAMRLSGFRKVYEYIYSDVYEQGIPQNFDDCSKAFMCLDFISLNLTGVKL